MTRAYGRRTGGHEHRDCEIGVKRFFRFFWSVPLLREVEYNGAILKRGGNAVKVFISWSGARSKEVAELMRDWIRCVLQVTRPWISTRDLDRGSIWFGEINEQLKDTGIGIICLTQENKNRPWILFEAGALMKGLTVNRVCTFLIDLEPKDVEDPLAQFNHTFPKGN